MISSAIAEMRTYGEGFIIVDQSPNLLDQSVIRNTNTKIILRLPDGSDRIEVGKAASLNEDQINEIPKLKTGVGVVYQNDWLQPVLCSIDEFDNAIPYEHNQTISINEDKEKLTQLISMLLYTRVSEENRIDLKTINVEGLQKWIKESNYHKNIKNFVNSELNTYQELNSMGIWDISAFGKLSNVINHFVNGNKIIRYAKHESDFTSWNKKIITGIRKYVDISEQNEYENALIQCILQNRAREEEGFKEFYFAWVERVRLEKGVVLS